MKGFASGDGTKIQLGPPAGEKRWQKQSYRRADVRLQHAE
ncbi:unnamed protein product [Amoebophrya sp. A25]|nr:unnamed protein product [Amoebophrya sp. A25]|eukprot:GSA25T00011205001.1